jgi:hypothetical protein
VNSERISWATFEQVKEHNLKLGERYSELLKNGYSLAWDSLEDALAGVHAGYGIFCILPNLLMLPDMWDDSKLKLCHAAFLTYKIQTDDDLTAAYNLATLGNYAAATVILRACMEYLCRGAFYDCISKSAYRATTSFLTKKSAKDDDGERGSIQRLLDDINRLDNGFLVELENESAAILDKLSVFMSSKRFRKMFPSFLEIVEQLDKWNLFQPIDSATEVVYRGGYHFLSLSAHGSIDHIDSGLRLVGEKPLTAMPSFNEKHFSEFISNFYQLLDIGSVLTFNVMSKLAPNSAQAVRTVLSHPKIENIPLRSFKKLLSSETV